MVMLSLELHEQLEMVHSWTQQFDKFAQRLAAHFARTEAREQAKGYLQGLLSSVERKNGWQLAEALGQNNPYGIQHLLGRAVWEADALRDDLIRYVIENLGDPEGVLIVDESGFLKKGDKSCGVARQYSGTAGRIENCQVGVFLTYASTKGHTFLDRQLYLPKEWTDDKERCQNVDVPKKVVFSTKPKMAKGMLERALLAGVPCRWVTGDALYGNDRSLQIWLQEQGVAHVMAVSGQEMVNIEFQQYRVKELLPTFAEDAWEIYSCGEGSKGPRLYAWAWRPVNHGQGSPWGRWLLVRKSLSDPTELTGYIAFAPADTPLQTLVRVAGIRWTIECCFESAKGEVGLDEYEVRSWHGWHRHMTLSMMAHAFLTVQRAEANPDAKKGQNRLPGRRTMGSLQTFKQSRGLWCA
jgi:SRSO17 transposase